MARGSPCTRPTRAATCFTKGCRLRYHLKKSQPLCQLFFRRRTPMNIDWSNFTPWTAIAGGVLIGIAAAMFVLINGRIAGISGIIGGLFRPSLPDIGWRLAFLAGLVIAPSLYGAFVYLQSPKIDTG